jgi:hypothetical protein
MHPKVWPLIQHYKEGSIYESNAPRAMTNEVPYMNVRTGKRLRVANVEKKTYIRQRRTQLDEIG